MKVKRKKSKMRKSEVKSYEKLEALSILMRTLASLFVLLAIFTKRVFFVVGFVIAAVAAVVVAIWSMKAEREEEEEE